MPNKPFTPEIPLDQNKGPALTTADEILAAIDLAVHKEQSCEVLVDLVKAKKLLKNLCYKFIPYKEGILLSFPQKLQEGQKPKSQIYVHNP